MFYQQNNNVKDVVKQEEERIAMYSKKKNDAEAQFEDNKIRSRKERELAIKRYQDTQIEEKNKLKTEQEKQKEKEFLQLQAELAQKKLEEERRQEDRKKKNKDHQNVVREQMKEESRMFAKTGIAIIQQ